MRFMEQRIEDWELVIFLRALGLFSKPIVIWHHTAVTNSSREILYPHSFIEE